MLELVKVRRGFWQYPVVRGFYYALMSVSLLLCIGLYVTNFIQIWGVPTVQVQGEYIVEVTSGDLITEGETSSSPSVGWGTPTALTPETYGAISNAKTKNTEVQGWITIPGTNINYPVLQAEDNEKYLRKDAEGNYRFTGSIFADYRDNLTGDRNSLSKNTVLYGHNINVFNEQISGEMFAQLLKFTDYTFASEQQYINFSTESDQMSWEIFSVFYSDTNFNFNNVNPGDEAVFNALVSEAINRSEYQYNVEVLPTDKILTLSTCSYKYSTKEEQRFVVMARLVPDVSRIKQKEIQVNPRPKAPSFVTRTYVIENQLDIWNVENATKII